MNIDWYKVRQWFKPYYVWNRFWWKYVPGVYVTVKWPVGPLIVDYNDPRWVDLGGAVWIRIDSADPNDHYRLWMETNVGRQGWDWDWDLIDNNVAENRLTIKFRKSKARWATLCGLMWS